VVSDPVTISTVILDDIVVILWYSEDVCEYDTSFSVSA